MGDRDRSGAGGRPGDAGQLGADRARLVEAVLRRVRSADAPALLAVRGDAGQGKSAVLAAVHAAVQQRGHVVVAMRGDACSVDLPYAGLLGMVTGAPADPRAGPAADLLDQLTSFTARSSPLAVAWAVGTWLRGLDPAGRLVVLIDDADLVDEDSLRVLAYAATRLRDGGARGGVVVHTTTRSVALLERLPVTHLRLDDLARDDAVGCAVAAGAARRAAERLVDRLGGNPLALRHAAPSFAPAAERSWPVEPPVAARLARDVDVRLAPLHPDDRRVLEAAAVTGDDLLEHLAGVRDGAPESLLDLLDRLESSGLVAAAGPRLRWRRPWMAVAVLRRLAADRRARLVAQLGRPAAPTPPPAGTSAALTPSERRVVDVIVGGASVKRTAAQLCLSDRTVGTHLQSAYRKLGVRSRGELAALVLGGPGGRDEPDAPPARPASVPAGAGSR